MKSILFALTAGLSLAATTTPAAPIKALIIDGQNNHDWKSTTPHLRKVLEETGLFTVEVATAPSQGDLSDFKPDFAKYEVLISNYSGQMWPKETQDAFVKFVRGGGGFVSVHAADNSFPKWADYNEMIGLGGWGGRNEKAGPYLRFRDAGWIKDMTAGPGGGHGAQHEFLVEARAEHPILRGLPAKWMHAKDELYHGLRGPAQNVTVLASALSDKTNEHEPMLMVIPFGKGRVFHTALGHAVDAVSGIGFQVTFARGVEWAATGKVTLPAPNAADLPIDRAGLRSVAGP